MIQIMTHRHWLVWWRVVLAILIALALLALAAPRAHAASLPATVYTRATCTLLWSAPVSASTQIADVIGGTGLRVTGISDDRLWYQVQYLGSVTAWATVASVTPDRDSSGKSTFGGCLFQDVPNTKSSPIAAPTVSLVLTGVGSIVQPGYLYAAPSATARITGRIVPGARAVVQQWAGDAQGDIWYLAHVQGQYGWIWGYSLLFDTPDPATHAVHGQPLWTQVAGKGMWFTNYFPRHIDIGALIAACKAAGITHLYPEVAISTDGFYGMNTLDRLVPAAHAAGITVVAWVYPYLNNVAADLAMTQAVIAYRTAGGDKVDGIAADIEERTDAPAVYAYGQVLRQMVGPDTVLVVTPYNPRARPSYPFPEVAASFNVIAPQDYWHSSRTGSYTAQSPRDLLTQTVTQIRAELGGKSFPIEELGQMYDMFSEDGSPGGTEPSAAEITGDMQAAKDLGCIGVSYFEWQTASPQDLDAFNAFAWK